MSGVGIILDRARIGLWSTPETQLSIPRLNGFAITVAYAATSVQFAGDTLPTGFRGQSIGRSYAMTARYMEADRADVDELLDLFDEAHEAPDSRLLLRTHFGQVSGLDTSEAIQVFGHQPTPALGLYWDVAFTAVVVNSTEVV